MSLRNMFFELYFGLCSKNKLGLTCAKLRSVKALVVIWQYYLVKGGKIIFRKIISEVPNNVSSATK